MALTQFPQVNSKVNHLREKARSLGATLGAERLTFVYENLDKLSPDFIYAFLDLDAFRAEVKAAQGSKAKFWYTLCTILGVLILVLTGVALFYASIGYQQDLAAHPADINQPFLQLWQNGFHGTTPLTFGLTILVDSLLLLFLLLCVLQAQRLERRAQKDASKLAQDLQDITGELILLWTNYGGTKSQDRRKGSFKSYSPPFPFCVLLVLQ